MTIFLRYILTAILVVTPLSISMAQSGASAVDFLRIGVSARNAATGGAFSAVSEGPFAGYYNPAGLAATDNIQLAGMHAEWLMDLRYEYLGVALPVGNKTGLGFAFSYLSLGSIEGYSDVNIPTGDIKAYDLASVVSLGHEFSQKFSAGVGVKGITEKLDDVQAFGFAFDIGAQYRLQNITAGFSLMNIGPKMKYDNASFSLPTTANLGAAYYPFAYNAAFLAGVEIPYSGDPNFKFGLEYNISRMFALRSGYDTQERADNQNGLSFGAGMMIGSGNIDYAYNLNNALGGAHQISFSWGFGGGEREESFIKKEPASQQIPSISEIYTVTQPDSVVQEVSQVQEEPKRIENKKQIYLVSAGKHSDLESAERHAKALENFGYSPKIHDDGQGNFRVVLAKAGGQAKAEKIKSQYEKDGVSCFVERQ